MVIDGGDIDFRDEIALDSLPPEVSTDAVPIPLEKLFPWHRPRKQKVRQDQWVGLATTLVRRLKDQQVLVATQVRRSDGSTFLQPPEVRYLTLPGLDYIDVRLIGEMCNAADCALTSVGFLSDAEDASLMARARVRETGLVQAGYIKDTSVTLPRSFESICGASSSTLAELKRRAPFHVVNIDACGSIAPPAAKHSGRLIDAIYRLVELQLSKATHRWLLFVTVDARGGDIDAETLESLCDAVRENAAKDQAFASGAIEFLNATSPSVDDAIASASGTHGRPFLDLFSLGFVKWLLHLAQVKQWSVRLKRSHCYSTRPLDDPAPSMCSLAIEFIPPPVGLRDPFNVTRQTPLPGGQVEDPSMQILRGTKEIDNLDELLDGDPELSSQLNATTHGLLKEAGYNERALSPLIEVAIPGIAKQPHRYPDLALSTTS